MKRHSQVSDEKRPRRRVRFLPHQIAEYAIGAALIAVGLQLSRGVRSEFVIIGALIVLLNLFSKGKLSVAKYLGRRTHHIFDLVIFLFAAASPFFGFVRHDWRANIAVEFVALLLIFVEQSTTYVDLPASPANVRVARVVTNPKPARPIAVQPTVNVAARQLGIVAGVTKRVVKGRRSARRTGN